MQYTNEQKKIIDAVSKYNSIKVYALAGTGKTTTLKAIAEHYPDMKMLYLAFNKAISDEAKEKFPDNVDVMTVHSLAFRYIGRFYAYNKRLNGKFNCIDIAREMSKCGKKIDVNFVFDNIIYFEKFLDSDIKCDKKSIRRFLYQNFGLSKDRCHEVSKFIYNLYFMLIKKRECTLQVTHDLYLKEFEQKFNKFKIQDKYDVILLDESQDSNMVTLSIFKKFNAKHVAVGDEHQKIYGFRGATNVMEKFNSDIVLHLTYTFRFSKPEQVQMANDILYHLKCESQDKLIKAIGQNRDEKPKDVCVITRTNARLIEFLACNDDLKPVRKPENFFNPIFQIFNQEVPVHKKYNSFREYIDILNEIAEKTDDPELRSCTRLIEKYNYQRDIFVMLYNKARKNRRRKLNSFISTAHSAKGLEFDIVLLSDDFKSVPDLIESIIQYEADWIKFFKRNKTVIIPEGGLRKFFEYLMRDKSHQMNMIKEEINLFYVAVTRAKKYLKFADQYIIKDEGYEFAID